MDPRDRGNDDRRRHRDADDQRPPRLSRRLQSEPRPRHTAPRRRPQARRRRGPDLNRKPEAPRDPGQCRPGALIRCALDSHDPTPRRTRCTKTPSRRKFSSTPSARDGRATSVRTPGDQRKRWAKVRRHAAPRERGMDNQDCPWQRSRSLIAPRDKRRRRVMAIDLSLDDQAQRTREARAARSHLTHLKARDAGEARPPAQARTPAGRKAAGACAGWWRAQHAASSKSDLNARGSRQKKPGNFQPAHCRAERVASGQPARKGGIDVSSLGRWRPRRGASRATAACREVDREVVCRGTVQIAAAPHSEPAEGTSARPAQRRPPSACDDLE